MNIYKVYVMGVFLIALVCAWGFTIFLADEGEWGKFILLGFTAVCGSVKWWGLL